MLQPEFIEDYLFQVFICGIPTRKNAISSCKCCAHGFLLKSILERLLLILIGYWPVLKKILQRLKEGKKYRVIRKNLLSGSGPYSIPDPRQIRLYPSQGGKNLSNSF